MRKFTRLIGAGFVIALCATPTRAQTSFVTFESGPVRPLALSPDASRLFAVNTPDGMLEIFDVDAGGLTHSGSVAVGMEPVAVAARTATEVWVVNHLSDSVSIVDVSGTPRVVRTLLVGDEPRDIVFAGSGGNRAFITTAHRGQNSPFPRSEYKTPGVGRADVWVFDALALGTLMGGEPLTVITLFGDKPRALAASPDGSTVYAAIYGSGNRTTTIHEQVVCDTSAANLAGATVQGPCAVGGDTMPGGLPLPHSNHQGFTRPEVGLIVRENRDGASPGAWQDELGRDWSAAVRFDLPDKDVFAIDANLTVPAETASFSAVGTTLFNMVVNPMTGVVYVSNTEAHNEVRFEGEGALAAVAKPAGEPATVRGRLGDSRITVIDGGSVAARHLNKHLDYDLMPQPAGVETHSLATPLQMVVTPDGSTLYVAAFGSSKIGKFDTAALENDSFTPSSAAHISVSGGGPAGLALDGTRLYALTRFNNSVVVIDLTLGAVGTEVQSVPLHNPEPRSVIEGRPFLYDALQTGSNGEASCASCHLFGDMDDLAWDLGNPDGDQVGNGNPFRFLAGLPLPIHPMKGPMITQSLRGLEHMGSQHWRGDRQGDSVEAFNAFNVAFPGLVGRDEGELSAEDMQKFTDFALQIQYPPNPIRNLDNSLRMDEQLGLEIYFGEATATAGNCNFCHVINPLAGHFGGDGTSAFRPETQNFKTPHLRNQYQKIGMFGVPEIPLHGGDTSHQGDQVRGFGFLNDGSLDTLARFLSGPFFRGPVELFADIEALLMVFDSDLPPMVGQQITRTATNGAAVDGRIEMMLTAAHATYPSRLLGPGSTQCDVIARSVVASEQLGAVRLPGGAFQLDDGSAPVAESFIRALSDTPGQETTYTCVPFGSGVRMGVDRDEDGILNRVDNCPEIVNPNQIDSDMNGLGNPCEPGGTTTTTTLLDPVCGNDVLELGEECDGVDLGPESCAGLSFVDGTLACDGFCTFDTSGCVLQQGPFESRSLKIARLTRPAGQQKLALKSDDLAGAGVSFDPLSEEVTIKIRRGTQIVYSATILADDPDWKLTGSKYKWRAKSAPHPAGLSGAKIESAGQPFSVRLKARDLDALGAAGAAQLTVQLRIGDDEWSGLTGSCTQSSSGDTLKCD